MYIKAKTSGGDIQYINVDCPSCVRFSIESKFVYLYSPDNLTLELEKTPELKAQLDLLLLTKPEKKITKEPKVAQIPDNTETSGGFEKFNEETK